MEDYFNTNKCFSQKRQPNSSWKNTQKLIKFGKLIAGNEIQNFSLYLLAAKANAVMTNHDNFSWYIGMIFQGIHAIAHIKHPRFIDVSGLCSWIWIHYNHHTMQFLCVWDVKVKKVKSKKVERLNYFLIQYNHCTVRHGSLISCSS